MLRLDGAAANTGRVLVRYAGTWGRVCPKNFDNSTASVVCKQLGFNGKIDRRKMLANIGTQYGPLISSPGKWSNQTINNKRNPDCPPVPWVWISPHALGFIPLIIRLGTKEHNFPLKLPSRLVPCPTLLNNENAKAVDTIGDILLQKLLYGFSCFFKEKIDKIRDNLPDCSDINLEIAQSPPVSTLNVLQNTTEEEVWKIICKSPAKSCMLDPIPTWLIKESRSELLPVMTNIINSSLRSSQVPKSMKSAIVTPLLKKSTLDPDILKNYRPVSNLSYISKLLERVVAGRLTDYMTENNLHEHLQSTYKPGHSTETALVKVQNDILTSIDQHGLVILVMLDLSAAFDTIDHDILFSRMENTLGITGQALAWFKSYLSGRTLRIKIDKSFSELQDILWSVPMGSVLGPLLFLIYLLPLGKLIRKHGLELHIYADDTQLYLAIKPITQQAVDIGVARLEGCLTDIYTWMSQNKLKLNADKTEVLVLGTPKQRAKISVPSISVNGEIVKILNIPIGNLGSVFDPSMNMAAHVSKAVKSANYHLRNIGRIRKYLTAESTKGAVISLVTSRFDYCNGLLCGMPEELICKLQRVQNNAARVITLTKKYDHITPVLKELHWLPVRKRIEFKILLLAYKCLHGTAPSYLREMLKEYVPPRTLRSTSKNLLCEPRTNMKTYGDRSFSACAPKLWNQLPNNIRAAGSVAIFKRQLKTHLFKDVFIK